MSFSTRHATMHVQGRNQNLGATTPLSGTLFGGNCGSDRLWSGRTPQTRRRSRARDRVAERVYPEFDGGNMKT